MVTTLTFPAIWRRSAKTGRCRIDQNSGRKEDPHVHIEVTETPKAADEEFIAVQVRAHNRAYTENAFRALCVFLRTDDGRILGGLTGKTYWEYLDVHFLWVAPEHRGNGLASKILTAAESEAIQRGCRHSLLNTFSFQAPRFYLKVGYEQVGLVPGYRGIDGLHDRHYMHKPLAG